MNKLLRFSLISLVAAVSLWTTPARAVVTPINNPQITGAVKYLQTDTIANLRLIPITQLADGYQCQVSGYYAKNDGGGGVYVWNIASTTADNGGTVIQSTGITTGRWILQLKPPYRVTARQFGAHCDWNGSTGTDDVSYLAAAIAWLNAAGGGTLVIDGKTKISSTLSVLANVNLDGLGSPRIAAFSGTMFSNSQIYNAGATSAVALHDTTGTRNRISNLAITGSVASGHGIDINGVYDIIIEDCAIFNHGGNGINGVANPSCQIVNCGVVGNSGIGINAITDINGWSIRGCHVQSSGSYGVSLNSAWGCSLTGNTIEGNTGRELYITTSGGTSIIGNYFEGTAANKLYIDNNSKALVIEGNFFNGPSSGTGITFGDASFEISGMVVKGNWFRTLSVGVAFSTSTGPGVANASLGPNYFDDAANPTFTRYQFSGTATPRETVVFDNVAAAWIPSTAYPLNFKVQNGGKVYTCATAGTSAGSGGPTGTGAGIADGSVVWNYTSNNIVCATIYNGLSVNGAVAASGIVTGSAGFTVDGNTFGTHGYTAGITGGADRGAFTAQGGANALNTGASGNAWSFGSLNTSKANANNDWLWGFVTANSVSGNGKTGVSYASFYASSPGNPDASTIANNYAFYADAQTRGTTNYVFYSAGAGLLRFGDTTEATTGGAGSVTTLGGIFATKKIITGSTLTTASGAEYDFGAVNTVSPTSPNRTITVIIAGTTYYIAAKTTND